MILVHKRTVFSKRVWRGGCKPNDLEHLPTLVGERLSAVMSESHATQRWDYLQSCKERVTADWSKKSQGFRRAGLVTTVVL